VVEVVNKIQVQELVEDKVVVVMVVELIQLEIQKMLQLTQVVVVEVEVETLHKEMVVMEDQE
jgi:hypothetical protein